MLALAAGCWLARGRAAAGPGPLAVAAVSAAAAAGRLVATIDSKSQKCASRGIFHIFDISLIFQVRIRRRQEFGPRRCTCAGAWWIRNTGPAR